MSRVDMPAPGEVGMALEKNAGARLAMPDPVPMAEYSPSALIHFAVERGVDVAQLERLVALAERMEERQAEKAFAAAFAVFRLECPVIRKNKTVDFASKEGGRVKYAYAELDEIAKTVDPILARCGFSYSWEEEFEGASFTSVFALQHSAGHCKRNAFKVPTETKTAAMSPQQRVGNASTYAQRRSMIAGLGLTSAEEDTDAQERTESGDVARITVEQAAELERLIGESKTDIVRFLAHYKITALAELPARRAADAISTLTTKMAKGGR